MNLLRTFVDNGDEILKEHLTEGPKNAQYTTGCPLSIRYLTLLPKNIFSKYYHNINSYNGNQLIIPGVVFI